MVNLASTLKEKVEVLCRALLVKPLDLLLHPWGGCFDPHGLRKVPVRAIVSEGRVQGALRLMRAFCFPKDWGLLTRMPH